MSGDKISDIDKLDRVILKVLAENPREPYADIADSIEEEGFEMSVEGVRYRVSKLLEKTSIFFLLAPEEHDMEMVRIAVSVSDRPESKDEAFRRISELGNGDSSDVQPGFWLVCRGVGAYDIYAVATAASNQRVDELLREVEELDSVVRVDYSIETQRVTDVDAYLSLSQLD